MRNHSQSYKSELVGVFGYPVPENPTIVMQEAAFSTKGLDWRYLTIEVRPEQLSDAMLGLRAFNMAGINLTIPHEVAVIQHLDGLSPEAELMGAVNTVVREGDRLIGHNTDGKGFVHSVREEAVETRRVCEWFFWELEGRLGPCLSRWPGQAHLTSQS